MTEGAYYDNVYTNNYFHCHLILVINVFFFTIDRLLFHKSQKKVKNEKKRSYIRYNIRFSKLLSKQSYILA